MRMGLDWRPYAKHKKLYLSYFKGATGIVEL